MIYRDKIICKECRGPLDAPEHNLITTDGDKWHDPVPECTCGMTPEHIRHLSDGSVRVPRPEFDYIERMGF